MDFLRAVEQFPPSPPRTWRRDIRVVEVWVVHSKMHKLDHSGGALVQVAATPIRWGPLRCIRAN